MRTHSLATVILAVVEEMRRRLRLRIDAPHHTMRLHFACNTHTLTHPIFILTLASRKYSRQLTSSWTHLKNPIIAPVVAVANHPAPRVERALLHYSTPCQHYQSEEVEVKVKVK